MSKKLYEMSLEELWEIFPIFLVEHNDEWKTWYKDEKANILLLIPNEKIYRISHIGSTYIPTIWAKNIVDILLEIKNNEDFQFVKDILLKNNWLCMSEDEKRISMN
ncbi:MAG: GrpB family protein, partial [Parvimonas sp.]|nr:GrpB family protein [Parvimonas sp.]